MIPSHSSVEDPRHIAALDGVRAIAIAFVLLMHFWTYPSSTPVINLIASAGWIGVDIFFVLSGFLITRILLASRADRHYFRNFYVRRTLRIFPAYYLLLGSVLLLLPLFSDNTAVHAARADWAWYAFYISNVLLARVGWQLLFLDITWSLAVEEQFYLFWPVVVRFLTRRALTAVALGLIVLLPVARMSAILANVGPAWLDLLTIFRIDSFAFGALLAGSEARVTRWSAPSWRRAQLALLLSTGTVFAAIVRGEFGRLQPFVLIAGHSLLGVASVLLIGICLKGNRLARVLRSNPLQSVGRVSYGMYLYHPLTLAFSVKALLYLGQDLNRLSPWPRANGALRVMLMAALAYVTASASFRWFETPFLRLKQGFLPAVASSDRQRARRRYSPWGGRSV